MKNNKRIKTDKSKNTNNDPPPPPYPPFRPSLSRNLPTTIPARNSRDAFPSRKMSAKITSAAALSSCEGKPRGINWLAAVMQPPTDQVYNMATAGDKVGEGETKTKKKREKKWGAESTGNVEESETKGGKEGGGRRREGRKTEEKRDGRRRER